jgi:hypothetical protein
MTDQRKTGLMVAAALAVGVGIAVLAAKRGSTAGSSTSGASIGGPSVRSGVNRDDSTLLPAFRKKMVTLFERMRARGYDPYLWEAKRSRERAIELANKGTGITLSMHLYGAAADVVSESSLWSPPQDFWKALRDEATKLGLVSGFDWTNPDKPHVQAITVIEQAAFRKMDDWDQERFVGSRLA